MEKVKLLKEVRRPKNVDLHVNKEIYALKHGNMPSIRKGDNALQNVQDSVAKASYNIMKLTNDLTRAKQGDSTVDIDSTIQLAMQAVTLNSLAMQQIDQIRRNRFASVLPDDLKGLIDVPSERHDEIFGSIVDRQKEAKAKAEVTASLTPKSAKRSLSSAFSNYSKKQNYDKDQTSKKAKTLTSTTGPFLD